MQLHRQLIKLLAKTSKFED